MHACCMAHLGNRGHHAVLTGEIGGIIKRVIHICIGNTDNHHETLFVKTKTVQLPLRRGHSSDKNHIKLYYYR